MTINRKRILAITALGAAAVALLAQQKTLAATLNVYVFPQAGQNASVQSQDESQCYSWAVQNTGSDPFQLQQQTGEKARALVIQAFLPEPARLDVAVMVQDGECVAVPEHTSVFIGGTGDGQDMPRASHLRMLRQIWPGDPSALFRDDDRISHLASSALSHSGRPVCTKSSP